MLAGAGGSVGPRVFWPSFDFAFGGGAGANPPGAIIGLSFGLGTGRYTLPDLAVCGTLNAGPGCESQSAWKALLGTGATLATAGFVGTSCLGCDWVGSRVC